MQSNDSNLKRRRALRNLRARRRLDALFSVPVTYRNSRRQSALNDMTAKRGTK